MNGHNRNWLQLSRWPKFKTALKVFFTRTKVVELKSLLCQGQIFKERKIVLKLFQLLEVTRMLALSSLEGFFLGLGIALRSLFNIL